MRSVFRSSRAASSICRRRIRSGAFILHNGRRRHLIAEIPAQIAGSPQINLAAQFLAQLHFHPGYVEQRQSGLRFELDQNIDVAFRAKVRRQDGSEKREFSNVMAAAEIFELRGRDREHLRTHRQPQPTSYQAGDSLRLRTSGRLLALRSGVAGLIEEEFMPYRFQRRSLRRERIAPPQPRKSAKIAVGRANLRAMLNGEDGEVGIRGKIAGPNQCFVHVSKSF